MLDRQTLIAILAVGLVTYAMRSGGYVLAGWMPKDGKVARFLRLAPGNLFVAFAAAGCMAGGWPSTAGVVAAVVVMMVTKKEWLALIAAFGTAALLA